MAGELDTERIAVVEDALAATGEVDSPDRARLLAVLSVELMFSDEEERRQELTDEAVAVPGGSATGSRWPTSSPGRCRRTTCRGGWTRCWATPTS